MKNLLFLITVLFCVGLSYSLIRADDRSSPKEKLTSTWRKIDFQLALEKSFETRKQNSGSVSKMSQKGTKSVAKALLFSAAIPGSGQIYNGSYLKSIAFLVIEASAVYGHFYFQDRGNDLEAGYKADADRLWNEDAYWSWISGISGIDATNRDALGEYERNTFSHFLPEDINQQYYENIGKYDQFVVGWKDFRNDILNDDLANLSLEDYKSGFYDGLDLTTISSNRNGYVELRKDSNDNFKRATNFTTLVLFNHVISALDAALTTKRYNKRIISASLRMKNMKYGNEIIPALALGVIW